MSVSRTMVGCKTHLLLSAVEQAIGYEALAKKTDDVVEVYGLRETDLDAVAGIMDNYDVSAQVEPIQKRELYATLVPSPGQILDLGTSEQRWGDVHCTSVISLSDARHKTDVEPLSTPTCLDLLMKLRPVGYRYTDLDAGKYGKFEHKRLHMGLIAQEVREALGSDEYGVWCDDGTTQSLRYEQFIAPLIKVVQAQAQKIEHLETQIEYACETIAAIQKVLRERPPI